MLVPKLKASSVLIIKGHSRESKAFLKSRDTRIPGMLCVLVNSIVSGYHCNTEASSNKSEKHRDTGSRTIHWR